MNNIISIVVTYNGSKWIHKCFGSLLNSTIQTKIIAIDNASNDKTLRILKEHYPEVEVIESDINLGFGKANNIGLKQALDENADYAFLLNQDAWVEKDTIEKLIKIAENNPDYSILSPIHLDGNEKQLDRMFKKHLMDQKIDIHSLKNPTKEIIPVNFVNAAFWLISTDCLKKVGIFDPIFPHYGEDGDYLNRVRFHGKKIGICTTTKGFHDRAFRSNSSSISRKMQMRFISYLVEAKNPYNKLLSRWSYCLGALKMLLKAIIKFSKNDFINGIATIRILYLYRTIKESRINQYPKTKINE